MTETSDPTPLDTAFGALYAALGQLVVASAAMEGSLRHLVSWLSGDDDAGWIIFEGQSVDWLVSNGLALLTELEPKKRWPAEDAERLEQVLIGSREIHRLRNAMIHGEWSTECLLEEDCRRRPDGSPADTRIFHLVRSRYRKGYEERQVAVADVEATADSMTLLGARIEEARRSAQRAWIGL